MGKTDPDTLSASESPEPRDVVVKRGPTGFGITLTEGTTTELLRGIFVTHISPNSSTSGTAGELKVGDQVVAVNGEVVNDWSSAQVAALMQKASSGVVTLRVATHTIVPMPAETAALNTTSDTSSTEPPPSSSAPTDPPHPSSSQVDADPRTVEIQPGQETLIEIEKGGKGLGLSIVGGSDTVLGSVVIHEVYPDGAAARDARLRPGDQVLEVNGESLRDIAHDAAIALLRRTPARVRLLVYRDLNLQLSLLDPSSIYNIFTIELTKKPGRGLGLSIVGRKGEAGVFVSEVVKGGVAESDGRLQQGDQILAVNGQNLTNAAQETAAAILKTCLGKVTLKIGRWKLSGEGKPGAPPLFPPNRERTPGAGTPTGNSAAPVFSAGSSPPKEQPPSVSPASTAAPTPATPSTSEAPASASSTPLNGKLEPASSAVATTAGASPAASTPPSIPESSPAPESSASSPPGGEASSPPKEEKPATSQSPEDVPGPSSSGTCGAPALLEGLEEEGSDTLLLELEKSPERQLGMGIGKRARGILVTSLQPGSVAAGKLRVGDKLLAVNGELVTDQSSAVSAVKASGPHLYLQVARPTQEATIKTGTPREVSLTRGEEGLGFSVVGGTGSPHGDLPILIKSVFSRGAAARDGRIRRGDQILAVNGESLIGVPHDQAVQILKEVRGEVVLTILPSLNLDEA